MARRSPSPASRSHVNYNETRACFGSPRPESFPGSWSSGTPSHVQSPFQYPDYDPTRNIFGRNTPVSTYSASDSWAGNQSWPRGRIPRNYTPEGLPYATPTRRSPRVFNQSGLTSFSPSTPPSYQYSGYSGGSYVDEPYQYPDYDAAKGIFGRTTPVSMHTTQESWGGQQTWPGARRARAGTPQYGDRSRYVRGMGSMPAPHRSPTGLNSSGGYNSSGSRYATPPTHMQSGNPPRGRSGYSSGSGCSSYATPGMVTPTYTPGGTPSSTLGGYSSGSGYSSGPSFARPGVRTSTRIQRGTPPSARAGYTSGPRFARPGVASSTPVEGARGQTQIEEATFYTDGSGEKSMRRTTVREPNQTFETSIQQEGAARVLDPDRDRSEIERIIEQANYKDRCEDQRRIFNNKQKREAEVFEEIVRGGNGPQDPEDIELQRTNLMRLLEQEREDFEKYLNDIRPGGPGTSRTFDDDDNDWDSHTPYASGSQFPSGSGESSGSRRVVERSLVSSEGERREMTTTIEDSDNDQSNAADLLMGFNNAIDELIIRQIETMREVLKAQKNEANQCGGRASPGLIGQQREVIEEMNRMNTEEVNHMVTDLMEVYESEMEQNGGKLIRIKESSTSGPGGVTMERTETVEDSPRGRQQERMHLPPESATVGEFVMVILHNHFLDVMRLKEHEGDSQLNIALLDQQLKVKEKIRLIIEIYKTKYRDNITDPSSSFTQRIERSVSEGSMHRRECRTTRVRHANEVEIERLTNLLSRMMLKHRGQRQAFLQRQRQEREERGESNDLSAKQQAELAAFDESRMYELLGIEQQIHDLRDAMLQESGGEGTSGRPAVGVQSTPTRTINPNGTIDYNDEIRGNVGNSNFGNTSQFPSIRLERRRARIPDRAPGYITPPNFDEPPMAADASIGLYRSGNDDNILAFTTPPPFAPNTPGGWLPERMTVGSGPPIPGLMDQSRSRRSPGLMGRPGRGIMEESSPGLMGRSSPGLMGRSGPGIMDESRPALMGRSSPGLMGRSGRGSPQTVSSRRPANRPSPRLRYPQTSTPTFRGRPAQIGGIAIRPDSFTGDMPPVRAFMPTPPTPRGLIRGVRPDSSYNNSSSYGSQWTTGQSTRSDTPLQTDIHEQSTQIIARPNLHEETTQIIDRRSPGRRPPGSTSRGGQNNCVKSCPCCTCTDSKNCGGGKKNGSPEQSLDEMELTERNELQRCLQRWQSARRDVLTSISR